MADEEYEYVPERQDDEDDEDFYSQTAYNPYYYEMKDEELIRESNVEIEGKERRLVTSTDAPSPISKNGIGLPQSDKLMEKKSRAQRIRID